MLKDRLAPKRIIRPDLREHAVPERRVLATTAVDNTVAGLRDEKRPDAMQWYEEWKRGRETREQWGRLAGKLWVRRLLDSLGELKRQWRAHADTAGGARRSQSTDFPLADFGIIKLVKCMRPLKVEGNENGLTTTKDFEQKYLSPAATLDEARYDYNAHAYRASSGLRVESIYDYYRQKA